MPSPCKESLSNKAPHAIRLSIKITVVVLSVYTVSSLFCGAVLTVHAQSDLQTTKHRDMVIDLGNGLQALHS